MDRKLLVLRDAIVTANFEKVAEMIEQDGTLINARLPGNFTPLMYAASRELPKISGYLIEMGAEIDILTAAYMGDTGRVRQFLESRPSLIRKHSPCGGHSLLHIAARYGDPALVMLLLEHGIDPNEARQPDRLTPLFFSYQYPYRNAELLLSHGADIHARGKHKETVLHSAIMIGDLEWIRFLLRQGADPDAQTRARQSPWMLAVKWKRFEPAALLVEFSRNKRQLV